MQTLVTHVAVLAAPLLGETVGRTRWGAIAVGFLGVLLVTRPTAAHFDPAYCCVKITPLNPTLRSRETGLATALPPETPQIADELCTEFTRYGFDVIVSIGDTRENEIGSNCGMAARRLAAQVSPSS